MDPLPTRRVGRPDATAWLSRAGRSEGGPRPGHASPGWERRCQSDPEPRAAALRPLAPPRAPRATARRRREPLGPCSRGAPHPRRPHRRCRLRTTPRSRSDPCTTEPREGHGASGSSAPAPPGEAPPEAPTRPRSTPGIKAAVFGVSDSAWSRAISSAAAACRRSSSARARAAASRVCRSASCRMRFLERTSHPVVDGLGLGQGYESGRSFLGTRHRPRDRSSPPTSTAINTTPAFVTMPPGERAFGRRDPLLPTAHRRPSRGVNRQAARLSPICSHPSPSTWRATYRPSSVRS